MHVMLSHCNAHTAVSVVDVSVVGVGDVMLLMLWVLAEFWETSPSVQYILCECSGYCWCLMMLVGIVGGWVLVLMLLYVLFGNLMLSEFCETSPSVQCVVRLPIVIHTPQCMLSVWVLLVLLMLLWVLLAC